MNLQGRRLPDTEGGWFPDGDIRAGDYWKVLGETSAAPSNLTGTVWFVVAPGPKPGQKMYARLTLHTVREEEDGTISIRSGDGSSNSVLVQRGPDELWHGYIEHGVWKPC